MELDMLSTLIDSCKINIQPKKRTERFKRFLPSEVHSFPRTFHFNVFWKLIGNFQVFQKITAAECGFILLTGLKGAQSTQ